MAEEPRGLKTWKMNGKGEFPPNDGRSDVSSPSDDALVQELRHLYERYGSGHVPERILDLARQVEDAHRNVRLPGNGSFARRDDR